MDTKAHWNKIISARLKDGMTIEDLSFQYEEGIIMEPNITYDEVKDLDIDIGDVNPWVNMAHITANSSTDKNTFALAALNQGANGLSFDLDKNDNLSSILEGIETSFITTRFVIDNTLNRDDVQREIINNGWQNARVVDPSSIIHIGTEDRISDLCNLANHDQNGVDIVVTLSKRLLFEIASLRAIRHIAIENNILDYQIVARYNVEGSNELGDYNLIEKTYKVMSGVLGCADEIITEYSNDESSRLTLNIHNILELESGMKQVLDPVGGAYYIEKMIEKILKAIKKK